MIMGEIDLSAGMVFAMAPFVMHFAAEAGMPAPLALMVGVAAAALVGLLNGLVTVKLAVPSFVTTLGTLFLVNGFTLTISAGTPAEPPGGAVLAQVMGAWGYSEILWALGIVAVCTWCCAHTRWGLHTTAAGANPTGAAEAGIDVASAEDRQFRAVRRAGGADRDRWRRFAFPRSIRRRAATRSCSWRWPPG